MDRDTKLFGVPFAVLFVGLLTIVAGVFLGGLTLVTFAGIAIAGLAVAGFVGAALSLE